MGAPRHLWSGDWRQESSAHAEELGARRARAGDEAEPAPTPPHRGPSAAARLKARLRAIRARLRRPRRRRFPGGRRVRVVVLVGLLTLLATGAAYAALSGGGSSNQTVASEYQRWLGIDLYNSPFGGPIVVGVAPGSPALVAGLQPGDVITRVDGRPVATVPEFVSAISGKHAGDRVVVQLERGGVTYLAHLTFATAPTAYP
jgi:membrane-associated protease RseP (regulator of RpoE activity)